MTQPIDINEKSQAWRFGEKQAVSPRLVAKALGSAANRAASGQLSPARFNQFVNRINKWTPGAMDRSRAQAIAQLTPHNSPLLANVNKNRVLPQSVQDAYMQTHGQVKPGYRRTPLTFRNYIDAVRGKGVHLPEATQIPKVQPRTIARLLGAENSAYYMPDQHTVSGKLLPSPPVLFHELGHALDLGGLSRNWLNTRMRQTLNNESMAWRRGSQAYENWRNILAAQNGGTPGVATTAQMLGTRHAPLDVYRLRHLHNVTRGLRRAQRWGMPEIPIRDNGPHGRVFSQTENAINKALQYTQAQQPVVTALRKLPGAATSAARSGAGLAIKKVLPAALGIEGLRRVFGYEPTP